MDIREVGWEEAEWIHLAQDTNPWRPLLNTVMNLRVPEKAGNSLTSWGIVKLLQTDCAPCSHVGPWFIWHYFPNALVIWDQMLRQVISITRFYTGISVKFVQSISVRGSFVLYTVDVCRSRHPNDAVTFIKW
jgi:hypothetical protein